MIKLENISLQIPIFTNETRHLKKDNQVSYWWSFK